MHGRGLPYVVEFLTIQFVYLSVYQTLVLWCNNLCKVKWFLCSNKPRILVFVTSRTDFCRKSTSFAA